MLYLSMYIICISAREEGKVSQITLCMLLSIIKYSIYDQTIGKKNDLYKKK